MAAVPIELLACPACRGALDESADVLRCRDCGRRYVFRNGAPELTLAGASPDNAARPGLLQRSLHAIVAHPAVYDVVQRLAGRAELHRRLRDALRGSEGALVLDVGAGTGTLEAVLPDAARYVWLDNDPQKLSGFKLESGGAAVLADATRIPFRDASVGWAISVGVSHHLEDAQLDVMLDELRRVVRDRVVFLDAVETPALTSRALWRYDRGAHPRRAQELHRRLAARFDTVTEDEFTVLHRYLLVTASPRVG